jgi:hypothetical protein
VLDARRVLELELHLHEGVVHAIKDPRHRSDEGAVPLLVVGVCGELELGQDLFKTTGSREQSVAGRLIDAVVGEELGEDLGGERTTPVVGEPRTSQEDECHDFTGFGMSNSNSVTIISRCLSPGWVKV